MCEKKNEGDNTKKGDGGGDNKKNNDSAAEKKTASVTVVLKIDMHCEGCASRIVKCVRSFQGVETVKSEAASGKLTVTGEIDPAKLREKLEEKTKKKVDLISPQPKKEKENDNKEKNKIEDENKNKENKSEETKKEKKADNEKKPKETPVTTAVLKLNFHCQGCIEKIQKTVTKTKGVDGITMDKEKQLVTVKGTMDVKKLVDNLTEKLKRPVEIVPPAKKEKEKENGNESGDKKKGGDGGGGKDSSGGGGNKGGGDGVNVMEYVAAQPAYGYGYYPGGPYGYPVQAHAPQIFSDENPNACVVM